MACSISRLGLDAFFHECEEPMPWSKKQQATARAVEHGWKPTGSAKGFTKSFASQVIEESDDEKKRKKKAEEMMGKGAHASMKR